MVRSVQLCLVGAGLSNGLIALQLIQSGFKDFVLIEKEPHCGGNHTWSFHDSDIPAEAMSLVMGLVKGRWGGQRVHFEGFQRTLSTGYFSMDSSQLHNRLVDVLPQECLYLETFVEGTNNHLQLSDGSVIDANLVLDGRGLQGLGPIACGYQKFVGLEMELCHRHELTEPIVMDADLSQVDGFRFMYSLPFTENTILVEDTRYSSTAELDSGEYEREVKSYTQRHYAEIKKVLRREIAALPIPFAPFGSVDTDVRINVGLRGDLFHPVTGYSVPTAVRLAQLLGRDFNKGMDVLVKNIMEFKRKQLRENSYFYMLNRMMFGAASDADRFRIFKRFYKLPQGLIENFYSGKLSAYQKLRILSGKPPVPVTKAVRCLTSDSWMRA